MALQPAAGARDLIPQQVEINHALSKRLAQVYKLWGYEEVTPPRVERLDTLTAGGAISNNDIVKLVSDDPLGLRPEMTASIARAACTRLSERKRPLRLWATGTIFQSRPSAEGGFCIEESLQSGVEMFGVNEINAELELLSLLIDSLGSLELDTNHKPTLLVGHTALMSLILKPYQGELKNKIKKNLIEYDRIGIEELILEDEKISPLIKVLNTRGSTSKILDLLSKLYGNEDVLIDLDRLFKQMEPIAKEKGVTIQLDPTFQPHFELYTGIVFQLVCEGLKGPVVIARGGRYDDLVSRCGAPAGEAFGLGFSFAIDSIREEITGFVGESDRKKRVLISYGPNKSLEDALREQRIQHGKGFTAILELDCCNNIEEAKAKQSIRDCTDLKWLNS